MMPNKSISNVEALVPSDKKVLLNAVDRLRENIESNKVIGLLFVALATDKTLDFCIRSHGDGITNIEAMGLLEYLRIQFMEDHLKQSND